MEQDIRIAAVVVLYKELLEETDTYRSLLHSLDIPTLVYDNSPNPQKIESKGHLTYVHDPSNPGVSKAYNYAMTWAKSIEASHLLLLDSDSVFPDKAIDAYQEGALQYPQQLILPSLFSSGRRVSPFYFQGGKSHYGDTIEYGAVSLGKVLAINAGALLPLGSLDGVSYNEALRLDWSDIHFFRSLSKTGLQTQHIPLVIQHGLSEHGTRSLESAQFRFSLYRRGIPLVADNWAEHLMMLFWAKLKALKLCLRYKVAWFGIEFFRRQHA